MVYFCSSESYATWVSTGIPTLPVKLVSRKIVFVWFVGLTFIPCVLADHLCLLIENVAIHVSVLPHLFNLPLSVLSGGFQFYIFDKLSESVHLVISSSELFEANDRSVTLFAFATRVDWLWIELVDRDVIHWSWVTRWWVLCAVYIVPIYPLSKIHRILAISWFLIFDLLIWASVVHRQSKSFLKVLLNEEVIFSSSLTPKIYDTFHLASVKFDHWIGL